MDETSEQSKTDNTSPVAPQSVVPENYRGLPSEIAEEMMAGGEPTDETAKENWATRKQEILAALLEEEGKREDDKSAFYGEQYSKLSDEDRQHFPTHQSEAQTDIAQAMQGRTELADLSAEEQLVIGKLQKAYSDFKAEHPDQPFNFDPNNSFSRTIDKRVYDNMVTRLAFGHQATEQKAEDQAQLAEVRTFIENENNGEAGQVEKSVVDPAAKNQADQRKLSLAASLMVNYFEGKSNLGSLLTENEKNQLETLRAQYAQSKAGNSPMVISLQSISPELRKLIVEDLPVVFRESDIAAIEQAKVNREQNLQSGEQVQQKAETTATETKPVGATEWRNVKRSAEVVAVGDLFGSAEALTGNLQAAGIAEVGQDGNLQWRGADKKLVFLGDIAGDRQVHGLEDLIKIGELRKQAEAAGGSVDVIVGNHDDFLVSFLMGTEGGGQADAFESCRQGGYLGLLELCKFGSDELKAIDLNSFQTLPSEQREKIWQQLRSERSIILQNMRDDQDGQKILESLCDMKITTIQDDTLFCHTDPTLAMVRTLISNGSENLDKTAGAINDIYQQSLREYLVEGKAVSQAQLFAQIKDIFLDTNNRQAFYQDDQIRLDQGAVDSTVKQVRESGINAIIHGHSPDFPQPSYAPKDLLISTVDMGAFKDKYSKPDERSVLRIGQDGTTEKGGNKKIIRQ